MREMSWPENVGKIFLRACGRMISLRVFGLFIPRLKEASHCAFGSEVMPARKISDRYAPSKSARVRTAEVKLEKEKIGANM